MILSWTRILFTIARSQWRGRAAAERRCNGSPQWTAQRIRLGLTVCFDESIKLGLMLADVLLLLPVEVLGLAALRLEVGQGERGRMLEF